MPYIGAGIQRFNTADGLTVNGNAEVTGTTALTGNATAAGTLAVTGAVTADAGVSIDNITIDGTEIDLSSGDLTLDVAGDIILDTDGADIRLKHAGTEWGRFVDSSNNFLILNPIADKDIIFNGVDGSSEISALTLDMSASGRALFNGGLRLSGLNGGDGLALDFAGSTDYVIKEHSNDDVLAYGGGSDATKFFHSISSGRFGVGYQDNGETSKFHVHQEATNGPAVDARSTSSSYANNVLLCGSNTNTTDSTYNHIRCDIHGVAQKFAVRDSGNAVNANNSYGSISDQRMKENIVDAASQWDDIKALQVRKYNRLGETQKELGVIAQELEAAGMGGLVEEGPHFDAANNPDEETRKSVKYSILYMKAVKALQEAMTRIETLETENATQATQIADLITRVTALEDA